MLYLTIFLYGDYIHYTLSDVESCEPNQLYSHRVELDFNIKNFDHYIEVANEYIDDIKKRHNKRTVQLMDDLNFWYNAVIGFVDTKITLNI